MPTENWVVMPAENGIVMPPTVLLTVGRGGPRSGILVEALNSCGSPGPP